MIKNFLTWLVVSSKDPRKVSLTVRAALLAIVPTVISAASAACGFGLVCIGVDATGLNQAAETFAAIVEAVLLIVAGVLFLWGFLRKIVLTATRR